MDGKIFKISGYLVDPNGENSADWIWEELRHLNDTLGQHVHVKEADIPDWTDENPLNYENCDLAECEKYFHDKYPVREDRSVETGKTYRHFKGKIVEVIAISQDTESPGQYYVVYKCEDGAIRSRPYGMFTSKVDRKKYPDADQEYRFEEVVNEFREQEAEDADCKPE